MGLEGFSERETIEETCRTFAQIALRAALMQEKWLNGDCKMLIINLSPSEGTNNSSQQGRNRAQ